MQNFKFILKTVGSIFAFVCYIADHRAYRKEKDKADKLECKMDMCLDYLFFTFMMLV